MDANRRLLMGFLLVGSLVLAGCRLPFKNLPGMYTLTPVVTNTPFGPSQSVKTPTANDDLASVPTDFPTYTPYPSATANSVPSATAIPTITETVTTAPTHTVTSTSTLETIPSATQFSDNTVPESTDAPVYAPVERTRYLITISLDYAGHFANVSEDVYFTNQTGTTLDSIVFGVNPNLWQGVFQLGQVSANGQAPASTNLAGQWLTIGLWQPLQPGDTVKIGITYTLTLPYSTAKVENFGYTARQTNLIDWYPFIPPFVNGNWLLPAPYSFGENLVYEKADFYIDLIFSNPAQQPITAASAPSTSNNGVFHYELPNARNFSFSFSPDFLLSTSDVGGITVFNYYFPEDSNAAARVLDVTAKSMNTFGQVFGPYPHQSITVVETELNDGLETDGLYFLSSSFYKQYNGTIQNNLSVIAIHETSHQWWYGGVGSDQANEPWLDEALATYSEHIYFENNEPGLLQWWWNFRVYSHAPYGWVDSSIYSFGSFPAYVNAVYFNGAEFLHNVRGRIGTSAFYSWMSTYYNGYNEKIATEQELFSALAQVSNTYIEDLKSGYFSGY